MSKQDDMRRDEPGRKRGWTRQRSRPKLMRAVANVTPTVTPTYDVDNHANQQANKSCNEKILKTRRDETERRRGRTRQRIRQRSHQRVTSTDMATYHADIHASPTSPVQGELLCVARHGRRKPGAQRTGATWFYCRYSPHRRRVTKEHCQSNTKVGGRADPGRSERRKKKYRRNRTREEGCDNTMTVGHNNQNQPSRVNRRGYTIFGSIVGFEYNPCPPEKGAGTAYQVG